MRKIDGEEIKEIELKILESLVSFCEEKGLKVYLGGGTLLGAVRHKGFIPWDDDIDVMMMREDYEKLLAEIKIGENYEIISCYSQKDYYYAFAKVVDIRTCMDEKELAEIKKMGVYIDVFPIDYAPDSKGIDKIFKRKQLLSKVNYLVNGKARMAKPKNMVKKIIKVILRPLEVIIPTNYPAKKIDALAKNNKAESSTEVLCVSGRYKEKEIMPKEYIEGDIEVEFEGKKYLAPVGYHDYLVKHYGKDYMKLPPKEKRISNHENSCYWRDR